MNIDDQPYHVQQQIRDLQALLQDWRTGKIPVKLGTPEYRIISLIETITLAVLVSPDDEPPGGTDA